MQQQVGPEVYAEDAHMKCAEASPAELAPQDFYWWSLEQAGGEIAKAVCSIESSEDALRFAQGMREEKLDRAEGSETAHNQPKAVSRKIIEILEFSAGPYSEGDPLEHFRILMKWGGALKQFTCGEESSPELVAGGILEDLDTVLHTVEERKSYLQNLADKVKERSIAKFSLTQDDMDELELMSLGVNSKERAESLGVDTNKVSKHRTWVISNKLGAKSYSHAVRIALEEGIITLDGPVKDEPDIDVNPSNLKLLDLYSLGMNKDEISQELGRSTTSVNARISDYVGIFSAENRQNLVYRAIKDGAITIEKGKYFHLNNAISHLHAVRLSLLSARAGFEMFLGRNVERTGAPAIEDQTEPGRIHDGNLRAPAEMSLSELTGMNDALLKFLKEEYSTISELHPLFDEAELQELEMESRGKMTISRNLTENERKILSGFRTGIREKLGAKNMAHAVALAISIGALSVDWARRYEEPTLPDSDPIVDVLPLIAEGRTREEIKKATGVTDRTLSAYKLNANNVFSTVNASSLLLKAFEKGIVVPDTTYKPLHIAAKYLNKAEINFAQALDSLSGFDTTEINRYISGLSEIDISELEQAAEGKTSKERAKEEGLGRSTINRRRKQLIDALGAQNIINAVAVAIEKGILPVEPARNKPELSDEQKDILDMLVQGSMIAEIERRKDLRRNTLALKIVDIRDMLSAETNAHAAMNAYRTGIYSLE